ncbi:ribosome silencing factor [Desulfomonile tiedjei]|uniref:Ribosomal silencing factor RsfS n=1 Tax=Desulfomonile tiedjei (strain ATCC 49306 / DSM 6799 / DCB-1) TaxID=706587 RepID=I4CCS0_DESTA|nr:ribosome silencing factor [Desulfomonile tiedjei]AFM27361.1 iojap-like ribosome-associated protein [Desulfomonile tiedjei DSM 6799]
MTTHIPVGDSKEKAETLLRAALSKKAVNPVLIRLAELTTLTDYFLIVSAGSGRQVKAIAEAILEDAKHKGIDRFSVEGVHQGNWALLDYGDVIVHVFQKSVREFYDLEGLWAEAPREKFPDDLTQEIEAAAEPIAEEDEEWPEL